MISKALLVLSVILWAPVIAAVVSWLILEYLLGDW